MKEPELILTPDQLVLRYGTEERAVSGEHLTQALSQLWAPSGVFMPAVRWVSQGGHAVIMERPPLVVRAAYRPAAADELPPDQAQHYNIPVPWQVYGIVFSPDFKAVNKMWVFARNEPVLDPGSELRMFPYPNVFNTAEACMGDAFHATFAKLESTNLSLAIAQVLGVFWNADFNEDAGPNTWYAPWRVPLDHLPGDLRDAVQQENVHPWRLLRFYSETALENFVTWPFPFSNNLNPLGADTIQHLIDRLIEAEAMQLTTSGGLYKALRVVHTQAAKLAKKADKAKTAEEIGAGNAELLGNQTQALDHAMVLDEVLADHMDAPMQTGHLVGFDFETNEYIQEVEMTPYVEEDNPW